MSTGIDYFNRGHWLPGIQERVSVRTRQRMFKVAVSELGLKAGQKMVDIGATPDVERLDSNCMIPWFHDLGVHVTLASPENITNLASVFPFGRLLPTKGGCHPIAASVREFDLTTSSAVLDRSSAKVFVQHLSKT